MQKGAYYIPAGSAEFSEEIKKSRFLTYIYPANTIDAAKDHIEGVKKMHSTARHHCWGFIAGAPDESQKLGCSDDGEPSGTAGKPILAQLMGSGIGEIVAIVVRYYGGVLLGTGGLVKAYGHGVQQALLRLETQEKWVTKAFTLTCEYSQYKSIEMIFVANHVIVDSVNYAESITLAISVPIVQIDEVRRQLLGLQGCSQLLFLR